MSVTRAMREAEMIRALCTGPWGRGENLPSGELGEGLRLRFERIARHAETILEELERVSRATRDADA